MMGNVTAGTIVVERFDSTVLKGNALGDPTERDVMVYLPPGYDPDRKLPVLYGVVGYTGTGAMLFNVDPIGEDLKRKLDRMISTGACPPCIVVLPDCFTRVGGNQYVNSSATGRYEDYLLREVIPFVERKHKVGLRGVWGKSSGGFGALGLGMRNPDVFSALACHSGDMGFEYCYLPDFPKALDSYREAGGPIAWLDRFWTRPNRRLMKDFPALNTLGMAAHYSPNPQSKDLGIDLPFDWTTGEFRDDVWRRWLAWDPARIIGQHEAALRKHKLVFIDCGTKDEFQLHWGARIVHAKLEKLGVPHRYEEFDDGHMAIPYRYDVSLPALATALAGPS